MIKSFTILFVVFYCFAPGRSFAGTAGISYEDLVRDNAEKVEKAILNGADINERITDDGFTPLMVAVSKNAVNSVKLLLGKKADLYIYSTVSSHTALAIAASTDNLQIAGLLIDAGARLDIKDRHGFEPLSWAVRHDSVKVAELMIENGADINAKYDKGYTPIIMAALLDCARVAELLIKSGADLNSTDSKGRTASDIAMENADPHMIALFKNTDKINLPENSNYTDSWNTLSDNKFLFSLKYPDNWQAYPGNPAELTNIYGLPILRYYYLESPSKKIEGHLYILDNSTGKPLGSFFRINEKASNSKVAYIIPRKTYLANKPAYIQVGYSYDPPFWGTIKAEIETIYRISSDKYIYIQMSISRSATQYLDTIKKITGSLSAN
ncbi:ankyrin repeat domain-containing protein [Elusimicrobiota bacterium]